MTSGSAGHRALFSPEWTLVLLLILVESRPIFLAPLSVQVDARRIISKDALGAANHIDPAVGLRIGNIVLECDHQARCSLDQGRIQVSSYVLFLPLGVALRGVRLTIGSQA